MSGDKWQARLKSLEQRALSFQSSPLSCLYKPRLSRPWQPSSVWRLFPRQSAAIAFTQHIKQDVHIFSLEKEGSDAGQRIFLVTSYSELWHYYSTHRQSLMHCYEVILEGAVCKLYFDLEFHKASNTHLDGKIMVAKLIQYVCEKMKEVYGVHCSAKDVLNLDSSTSEKFSRHLIFMLPSAAFKDNFHVGRFIHGILHPATNSLQKSNPEAPTTAFFPRESKDDVDGSQTKKTKCEEDDLSFLIVKSRNGQEQLLVDMGVYTKNRNFRLYKSSKLGKNAAFTVAEDNKFVPKPSKHTTKDESIFLASLITNISFTGQKILTYELPQRGTAGSPSLTLQREVYSSDLLGEEQLSPFKDVDDFVLTLVCKDGVQGNIRRWNYFASEQLLVYDIGKFRWCHNVKRFHKSNNIMIVVDLKEEVWYQRCHDPECRRQNYRSSSYPLPQDLCMSYILMEDEEDQAYLTDELGNIELVPMTTSAVQVEKERPSSAPQTEDPKDWGDCSDDLAYLEAMREVERATAEEEDEVSDELLLEALTECEG
ncbi:DNA-directed primase/polymerase protein isoform X1 [Myxocyprinus asiaticus]|uniref:DNA-directed primase/polymerase protein isoform X1 n=2 Tax=Myxocyprinus asiaticus TaxID=70543 RepID=UPI0022215442|nr:DNA-directed primase/polymerase protein isoform X1 [Myxocyprinus asiaticus]XP_051558318.1 DNA-directed primase/polymerase protein isoform X1 [Myxocyprinus asiaticus]XP_051558319.1 DNA-directed primase/polymerase protein isoform X1 [Myxocyprinus asiaticus]XP_051558320.1 DNA-directed primase/polymerase protein isoform X1 [Myxocyprinus asiaticus]